MFKAFSVCLPIILCALSHLASGQEVATGSIDGTLATGRVNGTAVRLNVTLDQVLGSTPWDPNASNEPPLELKDALRLAKTELAKRYPQFADYRWKISFTLTSIHEFDPPDEEPTVMLDRWVYVVRFRNIPLDARRQPRAPDIPIAVFFDRTAVVAASSTTGQNPTERP